MTQTISAPRPASALRGFAARRPILTYLLLLFGIGWAFLMPPALMHAESLALFVIPTALLADFGAAVLVTALADGRAGVRDLLRRVFRWRVHPGWYAVAVLGLPVLAVAGATVAFGFDPVRFAVESPGPALAFLTGLAFVPLVNLWEEAGWMGFVQKRLQGRHGALAAAVMTAPLFALLHLPLQIDNAPGQVLLNMGVLLALAVPFRIVIGWLHNRARDSVLVVALFHASFNVATTSVLFAGLVPGQGAVAVTAAVLVVWAIAAVVLTRGRLGLAAGVG
jgi:uncharacterized protein